MIFPVHRILLQKTIQSIEFIGNAIFDVITYVTISRGDLFELRVDDEYKETESYSISIIERRMMNQQTFWDGYNPMFQQDRLSKYQQNNEEWKSLVETNRCSVQKC